MGKGLSELQKTILVIAYTNQQAEGRGPDTPSGADIYYSEILAAHYGWAGQIRAASGDSRITGGHIFSRFQIGDKKYNAAVSAVSRAIFRLQNRGLVVARTAATSKWSGGSLTETGMEVAKRLS